MRLLKRSIDRFGSGSATLLPEEPEDMVNRNPRALIQVVTNNTIAQWHAYNLIQVNDRLRASAIRRVTTESSTGSTTSARVHINLTLRVTKLEFDAAASQLHVAGQVAEENTVVKLGGFHTLDLELQRKFTLEKADGWDSVALQVLQDAVDPAKRAEIWAVIMQDGLANVCLITEHQTVFRQRVEVQIPRKRAGKSDTDKVSATHC